MDRSGKLIKACTLLLMVVQLCLPLSGQSFIFGHWSESSADRGSAVCDHVNPAADPGGAHDQESIPHCHELEAPGVTAAGPLVRCVPVVARLAIFYCGTLLSGYGAPIDMPPELLSELS